MRTVAFPVVRAPDRGPTEAREPKDSEARLVVGHVVARIRGARHRVLAGADHPSVRFAADERLLQLHGAAVDAIENRILPLRHDRRLERHAVHGEHVLGTGYRRERAVDGVEVGRQNGPPTFCADPSRLHILRRDGLKNSVSQMPVASEICWPRTTTEPPPVASSTQS